MAYVEYSPVSFPCLAEGCTGSAWVTAQGTLHWYHQHSGGERPRGHDRCDACESAVRTATVSCLNEPTGEPGDRGCIGDGTILLYDVSRGTAVWYVMHGQSERPRMYPYCDVCRHGVVFSGPCRNVGCRGDSTVRCSGDDKQGLIFLARKERDASFWPPRNCALCRDFIKSLSDRALACTCCRRAWRWSEGRQIMLVRTESRSAFKAPELCALCLSLTPEERRAAGRTALGEQKARDARHALIEAAKTEAGRAALRRTGRARFLAAAQTLFRAPDRHGIEDRVKEAALTRIARLRGKDALDELCVSLEATGTDAGRIAALLANPAIRDDQAERVLEALAKLSVDGKFPSAFAERLKVRGGLGMTTALAGTASRTPKVAQAAAYEIHAAAQIANNAKFPYPFGKHEIACFHYRFQHNRYGSASTKRSYEGDIVIQHEKTGLKTFVDFKHSTIGKPSATDDNLERIFHGLSRGEIDNAVIVSNAPLDSGSMKKIAGVNQRIRALNREMEDEIPAIRTHVEGW